MLEAIGGIRGVWGARGVWGDGRDFMYSGQKGIGGIRGIWGFLEVLDH